MHEINKVSAESHSKEPDQGEAIPKFRAPWELPSYVQLRLKADLPTWLYKINYTGRAYLNRTQLIRSST